MAGRCGEGDGALHAAMATGHQPSKLVALREPVCQNVEYACNILTHMVARISSLGYKHFIPTFFDMTAASENPSGSSCTINHGSQEMDNFGHIWMVSISMARFVCFYNGSTK